MSRITEHYSNVRVSPENPIFMFLIPLMLTANYNSHLSFNYCPAELEVARSTSLSRINCRKFHVVLLQTSISSIKRDKVKDFFSSLWLLEWLGLRIKVKSVMLRLRLILVVLDSLLSRNVFFFFFSVVERKLARHKTELQ